MATWELQLVSRIVRTGDINTALQWGVTENDFLTSEGRGFFRHLLSYFSMPQTAGAVLGPQAVQTIYPNFVLCDDPAMTTEALCTEVRKMRLSIELKQHIQGTLELVDYDPLAAASRLNLATSDIQNLGSSKNTDVHFVDALGRTLQRMELKERGIDLSVAKWPWYPMQDATGGIEKDEYTVFYGRPKSMKSWVLAALIAWFFNCGKRLLIYTKEMTPDNIFMRVAAALAQIRYQEFRKANLSPQEREAIYTTHRMVRALMMTQTTVCLSGADAPDGGDTVPWLRSKAEAHKPDLIFIDGMYLMSNIRGGKRQKDNERVRDISRDLRRIPLDMSIPVFATIQANREAAKHSEANLDEIAFSDGLSQDATCLIRVINEQAAPTIAMLLAGAREFTLNGFRIYGVPATNFEYAGPITAKEAEKAKEQDVVSEDGNRKVPSGTKKAANRGAKASADVIALQGQVAGYLNNT